VGDCNRLSRRIICLFVHENREILWLPFHEYALQNKEGIIYLPFQNDLKFLSFIDLTHPFDRGNRFSPFGNVRCVLGQVQTKKLMFTVKAKDCFSFHSFGCVRKHHPRGILSFSLMRAACVRQRWKILGCRFRSRPLGVSRGG